MAKKGKRKVQQKKGLDTIQIAAIIVVVLVVAGFAWGYFSRSQTVEQIAVGNSPACEPFASIPASTQYSQEPPLLIDTDSQYFANFKMEDGGEFVVQLYPDKAPITVNSFVFLACKGFFDGVTFHRVLDGFMAQGGDPTGTGTGGPGYRFADEANGLTFDRPGLLAMANSGPNTNGSQFFITYGPTPHLNGKHTIFGEVVEGADVVNSLTRRDPRQNPTFTGDVIESITITQQ